MFRAIICPSSGAQDCGYSNVVYCPNVVVGRRSEVRRCRLCVRCEGCCSSTYDACIESTGTACIAVALLEPRRTQWRSQATEFGEWPHFRHLRPSRHRYNEVGMGGRSLAGSSSRRLDRSCVTPWTQMFSFKRLSDDTLRHTPTQVLHQKCRLCVRCEGCCSSNIPHTEHTVYATAPRTSNLLQHQDNTRHCCNHSLTLLKMGKWLPETCWDDSKINKIVIVASSCSLILFNYIDDARSNTKQICSVMLFQSRWTFVYGL